MNWYLRILTIMIVLASLQLLFLPSCDELNCKQGNNEMAKEVRIPGHSFEKISLSSDFLVFLYHSDNDSLTIEAESNLIPEIITEVTNQQLLIGTRDNTCLNPGKPVIVKVFSHSIRALAITGSGTIESDTLQGDQLQLNVSGSGSMKLPVKTRELDAVISGSGSIETWGEAGNGRFNISGSGNIESYGLSITDCFTNISGSGNHYVFAKNRLNATISGSGNVFYQGNPDIETQVSGSGKVSRHTSGGNPTMNPSGSFNVSPLRPLYMIY